MKSGCFFLLRLLVLWTLAALPAPLGWAATRPPNIVVILADDLGWSDLACYGADLHETPHLDQLAREGVKFTKAYSPSPVCTPTRAALMTGKHPARLGITIWSEGALSPPRDQKLLPAPSLPDLPLSETTIARHLQTAGYLTALVGKWHLGDASHYPEAHGFDVNIGGTHWGAPQTFFWPYRGSSRFASNEFRYVPHLEYGPPGEYLTDRLTAEALKVISQAGSRPFLLFLAHHAPHTPIEAKAKDIEYFRQKLRPSLRHQNAVYAAMVKSLDDSVGEVMAYLEKQRLASHTMVLFASDNGGFIGTDRRSGQTVPVTSNAPLRSGKGSLYEGGIRVPLIVKWPGVTVAGGECAAPVVLTDMFPTLLAAAGLPAPANASDGLDLSGLLRNPAGRLPRSHLCFHYPHYYDTTTPASAILAEDWKLLEFYEDQHWELFNLKDDPGEKASLAAQFPDQAGQLLQALHAWLKSVGARLPTPNLPAAPSKIR